MEGNESLFDRTVRAVIGAIMLAVVAMSLEGPLALVEGAFAIIIGVIGAGLLLTGLLGWCPAYALFGIRTCEPRQSRR